MNSARARLLASAAGLAVVIGLCLPALPASASNPTATPSWGAANLISYTDSDFEGGIGDWSAVSNTTLSDDSAAAFLHADSLKAVATASGTQQFKLGASAGQINVTAGDTYRVSGWMKAPALSGRTVTWAMGFYTSSGSWLGWTSATTTTMTASGSWQYESGLITAPATAAYAYGSPRLTEAGVAAGEALLVDEVLVQPYRAATLIGAEPDTNDSGTFAQANTAIGPLQSTKVFYGPTQALPATYSASSCAGLPSTVTCLVSYKDTGSGSNVVSFVQSIPAGQPVIMVWWQEPEKAAFSGPGTNGQNFVTDFEAQSALIRGAGDYPNVLVAMDAETYLYAAGTSHSTGADCSFIPPASSVDLYLADHYEQTASGNNVSVDSGSRAEWNGWLSCASPQDKPIGIAEYGLNCGGTSGNNPDALTTSQGMAADNTYLEGQPDGLPVLMWEYWWDSNVGCQFTAGGSPDGTQAVQQWQADETQNGGGA